MTKQYPIIFQGFSIEGLKKQWEWQQKMAEWEKSGSHVAQYQEGQIKSPVITLSKGGGETFTNLGCKTETRRLTNLKEINKNPDEWFVSCHGIYTGGKYYVQFANKDNLSERTEIRCPYGVKGDELWVRESFAEVTTGNKPHDAMLQLDNFPIYVYKEDEFNSDIKKWKSPLFMPRKASRITLINEGVTIQRLHDITEEGALREGITEKSRYVIVGGEKESYVATYANKWAEMHGEESRASSPWVWVLRTSVKSII